MGTHSHIIEKTEEGFRYVYCHYDGYPDWNGIVLHNFYDTSEKVKKLLDLGNISTLDREIGEKHDFGTRPENQSTFYGRDRGDANQEAQFTKTVLTEQFGSWLYLWDGEQWLYCKDSWHGHFWKPLSEYERKNIYNGLEDCV